LIDAAIYRRHAGGHGRSPSEIGPPTAERGGGGHLVYAVQCPAIQWTRLGHRIVATQARHRPPSQSGKNTAGSPSFSGPTRGRAVGGLRDPQHRSRSFCSRVIRHAGSRRQPRRSRSRREPGRARLIPTPDGRFLYRRQKRRRISDTRPAGTVSSHRTEDQSVLTQGSRRQEFQFCDPRHHPRRPASAWVVNSKARCHTTGAGKACR